MIKTRVPPSLQGYFRKQAVQWAVIGFALTVVLALPCFLYTAKVASERQLMTVARSAARAFRPMFIEGSDVRSAELQMRRALDLQNGESAVVRDPSLQAIYPLTEADKTIHCGEPGRNCWSKGFQSVSVLYPIYFDEDTKAPLWGYLEVTLKPVLDGTILSILAVVVLIGFVVQAYGLLSALRRAGQMVTDRLGLWADQLIHRPTHGDATADAAPFDEFLPMQTAVNSLHEEIEKLQRSAAQEAKDTAQTSILREIGHDLKTPLSQLRKFLMLHFDRLRQKGQLDESDAARINRVLNRAGDLVQKLKLIYPNQSSSIQAAPCKIQDEAALILSDLQHEDEVVRKGMTLKSSLATSVSAALISKAGFYQVLENLIRNAVEAASNHGGNVTVTVANDQGIPTLSVRDDGPGIPLAIQSKIFDFDFTTKLSQGTGLGLGIVKRICQDAGAEIRVVSTPGHGAEFIVTFRPAPSIPAIRQSEEVQSYETQSL
ncbi:HAMP domain-containing sensor histidine kinase [Bdellovibrionota bacterium FG-1]